MSHLIFSKITILSGCEMKIIFFVFFFCPGSLGISDLLLDWADGSQSGSGLTAVQINPEFHPMEFSLKRVATSSISLTRQSFSGTVPYLSYQKFLMST